MLSWKAYYLAAWVSSLGRDGLEQSRTLLVVPSRDIVVELSAVGEQGFALLVGSEVVGVPGGGSLIPFVWEHQLWT